MRKRLGASVVFVASIFLATLAGIATVSCSSSDSSFGAAPCAQGDPICSNVPVVDAGYDAGATTKVTGVIDQVTDPSFALGAPIPDEAVTVIAPTPVGGTVEDAVMSASFELDGARVGDSWFFVSASVKDGGATSTSIPTFALRTTNLAPTTLSLPLMSSATLAQIASDVGATIAPANAHVALLFTRGGMPLEGVTLATLVPATIAFDVSSSSPATYTTSGTSTGTRGVLVILDVPATGDLADLPLVIDVPGKGMVNIAVPIESGCMTIGTYAM